jgi:hypothetical protein
MPIFFRQGIFSQQTGAVVLQCNKSWHLTVDSTVHSSILWTLTACKICPALLSCRRAGRLMWNRDLEKPCLLFLVWKNWRISIVEICLPFSRIAHLPACVRFAWLVWPLKCVCTCTGSDFNATDVHSGSHSLCIRK